MTPVNPLLLPLLFKDTYIERNQKTHEQVWPRGSEPDHVSTPHSLLDFNDDIDLTRVGGCLVVM